MLLAKNSPGNKEAEATSAQCRIETRGVIAAGRAVYLCSRELLRGTEDDGFSKRVPRSAQRDDRRACEKIRIAGRYRSENRSVIAGCAEQGSAIAARKREERGRESACSWKHWHKRQSPVPSGSGRPLGLWRTAAPTAPTIAPAAAPPPSAHHHAPIAAFPLTSCSAVTTNWTSTAFYHERIFGERCTKSESRLRLLDE